MVIWDLATGLGEFCTETASEFMGPNGETEGQHSAQHHFVLWTVKECPFTPCPQGCRETCATPVSTVKETATGVWTAPCTFPV